MRTAGSGPHRRATALLGRGLIPAHQLGERDLLLAYLTRQRELVFWKLEGLDDDKARAVSTPSGLTVHVIVSHLTGVERGWLREHFAGQAQERVREKEFVHDDAILPYREVDVGRMLEILAEAVPDSAIRRAILADNPAKLYGFGGVKDGPEIVRASGRS